MLDLKPVLKVNEEGKLAVVSKERGRKKAVKYMLDNLTENITDDTSIPITVIHADCEEDCDAFIERIKERYPDREIWKQYVGPVIGTHCGPNTLGLIFMKKD